MLLLPITLSASCSTGSLPITYQKQKQRQKTAVVSAAGVRKILNLEPIFGHSSKKNRKIRSLILLTQQELSYRQQIARQLRTQYAVGIYRHKYYTVTLKSRLRVTQGQWKRNHWIDHTRLGSRRVI